MVHRVSGEEGFPVGDRYLNDSQHPSHELPLWLISLWRFGSLIAFFGLVGNFGHYSSPRTSPCRSWNRVECQATVRSVTCRDTRSSYLNPLLVAALIIGPYLIVVPAAAADQSGLCGVQHTCSVWHPLWSLEGMSFGFNYERTPPLESRCFIGPGYFYLTCTGRWFIF